MTSADWFSILCTLEECESTPSYHRQVIEALYKGELQTIRVAEIEEIRAELRRKHP